VLELLQEAAAAAAALFAGQPSDDSASAGLSTGSSFDDDEDDAGAHLPRGPASKLRKNSLEIGMRRGGGPMPGSPPRQQPQQPSPAGSGALRPGRSSLRTSSGPGPPPGLGPPTPAMGDRPPPPPGLASPAARQAVAPPPGLASPAPRTANVAPPPGLAPVEAPPGDEDGAGAAAPRRTRARSARASSQPAMVSDVAAAREQLDSRPDPPPGLGPPAGLRSSADAPSQGSAPSVADDAPAEKASADGGDSGRRTRSRSSSQPVMGSDVDATREELGVSEGVPGGGARARDGRDGSSDSDRGSRGRSSLTSVSSVSSVGSAGSPPPDAPSGNRRVSFSIQREDLSSLGIGLSPRPQARTDSSERRGSLLRVRSNPASRTDSAGSSNGRSVTMAAGPSPSPRTSSAGRPSDGGGGRSPGGERSSGNVSLGLTLELPEGSMDEEEEQGDHRRSHSQAGDPGQRKLWSSNSHRSPAHTQATPLGIVGGNVTSVDDSDDSIDEIDADEYEVDYLINEGLVEAHGLGGSPGRGSARDVSAQPRAAGGGRVIAQESYWSQVYHRVDAKTSTQLLLMFLTIYALFGDDLRLLLLPKSGDALCSMIVFAIFLVFSLEWAAQCMFKPDYTYSLFFWLDLLATASLVTDIIFLSDWIFGEINSVATVQQVCVSAAMHDGQHATTLMLAGGDAGEAGQMVRTGRAARVATRTARLVRIVRVLRVLRVFKVFRFFGGFGGAGSREEELKAANQPVSVKSSTTKMGAKLAERISQRVILVVLTLFVGVVMTLQLYQSFDTGPEVGLEWMDNMRVNMTHEIGDDGTVEGAFTTMDNALPPNKLA
jgi:hypothetical protein